MSTSDDEAERNWQEAQAYRDEHERLQTLGTHLSRAVVELTRASSLVGDHALAVPLRKSLEDVQLLQAQAAAASERALAFGQIAARRARAATVQRQVDEASWPDDPAGAD